MDRNNNSTGSFSQRTETFVPLLQVRGNVLNRHSATVGHRVPGVVSRISLNDSQHLSTARFSARELPFNG
ncbi:unnamed protein product [Bursaphelenchus okinawaensis]|uniref:Uncharacterized protein n=1 Tax=Bursaphelenchus okinawaensis TaxID=465554 RepID=A0A811L757_9BILA|nr:unnamed protein product [Bursaphelenchus okinawaensis]CAG9118045.1 unnamed protein product [Bursaphelenchus okinawaensis]